jgi:hypothetical protein
MYPSAATLEQYLLTCSVSDSVDDVVMSYTCNMNYGCCWEGRGRVREQGVGSRSTTRDHDHQKRDLQVSKKKEVVNLCKGLKAG